MSYPLIAMLPLVAAVAMVVLSVFAIRRSRVPVALPFSLCTSATGIWCAAYSAELILPTLSERVLAAKLEYLGIATVPPAVLAIALHASRRGSTLTRGRVAALMFIPVVTVILTWTNEHHNLQWTETSLDDSGPFPVLFVRHGPWFWVHLAYGYLVLLYAMGTLVGARMHRTPDGLAMLAGMAAPWAANVVYVTGATPVPGLDLTPFAFAFTAGAFAWGLRRGMLALVPIAREFLLERMGDGMIVVDRDRRVVDLNPAGEALLQTLRVDAMGLDLADAFPEVLPIADLMLASLRRENETTVCVMRGDRSLEVRALQLGTRSEGVRGLLILVRDVTDRTRAEKALREAMVTAESAAVAKSRFLAMMSHEIRTPMNGILGTAELLLRSDLSRDQRDLVRTIDDSAEALLTVINDILDFSKIEVGRLEILPAPFDLERVVHHVGSLLHPRAVAKGLQFRVEYPEDAPRAFLGDAGRIRQALLNLAGNAVKFTEYGEISLVVGVGDALDAETPDRPVSITVRDTGIGIPRDVLPHVFEEFTQLDPSMARRHEGTGLGLAITRQLVELMGGTITADSEPGQGSSFRIELTLVEAIEGIAELPAAGDSREAVLLRSRDGEALRVLLAEDNEVNQRVAALMLRSLGAVVDIVGDGREAVELRFRNRYDVILMDLQMPGMDGLEATRTIRSCEASGDRVPIVALTANALPEDREQCLQAGMDHHLGKPIRRQELADALRQVAFAPSTGR